MDKVPLSKKIESAKNFSSPPTNPLIIDWKITQKCNLKCIHCCSNSGQLYHDELTTQEVKSVIDQLSEIGVYEISFNGGEPLCRCDFYEITEYAKKRGFILRLATNGTLIGRDEAKVIARIFKYVQISLDGTGLTHDFIRGSSGCYESVIRSIELLTAREAVVNVATVMTAKNIQQIPELLHLATKLRVSGYRLMTLKKCGKAVHNFGELYLSPHRMRELYDELSEENKKLDHRVKLMLEPIPFVFAKNCDCETSVCGGAVIRCTITANGFVQPCDVFDIFIGGNIREKGLIEIWQQSHAFKEFRRSIYEISPQACQCCVMSKDCRGGCKGMAFTTFGTIDMPDPLCPKANLENSI